MDEKQTTQTAAVEDGGAPKASNEQALKEAKLESLVKDLEAGNYGAAPTAYKNVKVEGSERVNEDGSESVDYMRVPVAVDEPEGQGALTITASGQLDESAQPTAFEDPASAPTETVSAVAAAIPDAPQEAPFQVKNRSRATRVAKLIYGPFARVWIGRDLDVLGDKGIHIGTEVQAKAVVQAKGKDFTEALRQPVEDFINGAETYAATKTRIRDVQIAGAENLGFALDALKKWPEYEQEVEAEKQKRVNPILAKIAQAE